MRPGPRVSSPSAWRRHGTIRASCTIGGCWKPPPSSPAPSSSPPPSPIRSSPRLDRVGRLNTDDGRWSIWVVAWVADVADRRPRAASTTPTSSIRRATRSPTPKPTSAPVCWRCRPGACTGNPYLAHNTVVVVGFVLAVAGAYYLVRYLSGSREAAAVAGVLFGFCPFIFARTAHIQLLLTGGLPFAMLAFHRLVDRPTLGRALALGAILFAQALSCAYYGIFAGLMVGLGDAVLRASRAVSGDRRATGCSSALAAAVAARAHAAVLPALHSRAGPGVRPHARRRARLQRQRSAPGSPRRRGPIAGGSPRSKASARCCSPGVLTSSPESPAPGSSGARRAGTEPGPPGLARDVRAASTSCLARARLLGVVRARRRPLLAVLRDDSRVRAAARAGPDGDHRDAGAGRAVGRGAGTVAARARPSPRVGRRAGRAGGARAEHGAADRAARCAAGARGLSHAGPAAARPRGGVSVLLPAAPTSPATPSTCWAPPSTGSRW